MCMRNSARMGACLLLAALLLGFLAEAGTVRASAGEALALCARTVIPALFPFLVVSTLLVSLGLGERLAPRLAGLMTALFRQPGSAGTALLLGLIGGYPIGARTAADLYRRRLLTAEEARRLLTFCNNSNPVFLISVLGAGVFGSVRAGVWLWLIHLLSALLTGLVFRGGRRPVPRSAPPPFPQEAPASLSPAFVAAVGGSAASMVPLCGFVVFFYVLAKPLSAIGGHLAPALVGLVELFSLTPLLTPDRLGFILAAGMSGWGGLSVLAQTAAVLADTGLPLSSCVKGKALQGFLSAALAAALSGYVLG